MITPLIPDIRRSMLRSASFAAILTAAVAGGGLITAAPVSAQTAPAGTAVADSVVQGRILDRFGDRLVIEGSAGRILVDVQAVARQAADLAPGQAVVAEGLLNARVLQARRISAADSEPVVIGSPGAAPVAPPAPVPPPAPEVQFASRPPLDDNAIGATLQGAGFTAAGAPVRDGKDTEIAVRDGQGRAWTASLDRFGRLSEVELADYDDDNLPARPAFAAQELSQIVARGGFQARGPAERHDEHFEILALNRRSELIELHVDFAGQIYKQVWVR
ncbi:MAG: hypothetical protein J0H01_21985 [Rhizobiales bacterium]|nr:hypothetical protein [Hyphomicrobiales bacterium]